MKLLLIDDDTFLRDMYALKFSESGHTVTAAESAAVALTKITEDPHFEIILLDMVMPAMSGIELIKVIKECFPDMAAKYIMLSNQGQQADINQAREAGAVGCIIKTQAVPRDVVREVEDLAKK